MSFLTSRPFPFFQRRDYEAKVVARLWKKNRDTIRQLKTELAVLKGETPEPGTPEPAEDDAAAGATAAAGPA